MAEIPLTKGRVAIVDDDCYEELAAFNWHFRSNGYAARHLPRNHYRRGVEYMHRRVLGGDSEHIDHVNGDKLDNRRSNLRPATRRQNMANRVQRRSKWGFAGVSYYASRGSPRKWAAYTVMDGRKVRIGFFDSAVVAAHAYDDFMRVTLGEFATLNFPRTGERGFRIVPNSVPTDGSDRAQNGPDWAQRQKRGRTKQAK